jgi:hypothetical protein
MMMPAACRSKQNPSTKAKQSEATVTYFRAAVWQTKAEVRLAAEPPKYALETDHKMRGRSPYYSSFFLFPFYLPIYLSVLPISTSFSTYFIL